MVKGSEVACFKPPALPSPMCCSSSTEGKGIKPQKAACLLPSLCLWQKSVGREGFEVMSEPRLQLTVASWDCRSKTNYRDIRWYVKLDWMFPVDSFGAKARNEGRKQSRWQPWIKSLVSFFSGAATMPASCETRLPCPFAPLLPSQALVSRRGKPSIWTLVTLACADDW